MTANAQSLQANIDFLHKRGRVWIMGVLNATPDSFYAPSRIPDATQATSQVAQMIEQGADVLDIGGESTRPGAAPVPVETELRRVVPIVKTLHQRWPEIPLSIDTQKAEVARQAVAHGASVINDISALRHDPEMATVAAEAGCALVLMHMQGTPQTMQNAPRYGSLMDELKSFFEERMAAAVQAGVAEDRIILDPGIGFGKTLEHNLEILQRLAFLKTLGRPLLVGVSRKSFLGRLIKQTSGRMPPPEERLDTTLAATLWAVQQGAVGVRVHDVLPTRQVLDAWHALSRGEPG